MEGITTNVFDGKDAASPKGNLMRSCEVLERGGPNHHQRTYLLIHAFRHQLLAFSCFSLEPFGFFELVLLALKLYLLRVCMQWWQIGE